MVPPPRHFRPHDPFKPGFKPRESDCMQNSCAQSWETQPRSARLAVLQRHLRPLQQPGHALPGVQRGLLSCLGRILHQGEGPVPVLEEAAGISSQRCVYRGRCGKPVGCPINVQVDRRGPWMVPLAFLLPGAPATATTANFAPLP